MSEIQHFLYQFTTGPDPERSKLENWGDKENAIAQAHWEYLQEMHAQQRIILAGRSQDDIGPAIVVFKAKNERDAPCIHAGRPLHS